MTSPYRTENDKLGESERESAALIAFGKWKVTVTSRSMMVCALAGVVLGAVGYWFAQEMQFEMNGGVAMVHVNVAGAALPFAAMLFVGVWIGRRLVRLRAPAKLAELAKGYEVSEAMLTTTVRSTVVM
jgi:hypothetical protein